MTAHLPRSLGAFVLVVALCKSPWKNRHQADAFIIPRSLQPTTLRFVGSRANTNKGGVYTSQRPLEEILLELETKGIEFSPTATKSELESLLSRGRTIPQNRDRFSTFQPDVFEENPKSNSKNNVAAPRRRRSERKSSDQEGRRRKKIPDIEYYSEDEFRNERGVRRRRRQRRNQGQSVSPSDTLFRVVNKTSKTVARAMPGQVVDIGSKATRIASRKTQQLFNELVDLTYDDSDTPKRRTRRPSSSSDPTRRQRRSPGDDDDEVPPRRARRREAKIDRFNIDIDPSPTNESSRAERKAKRTMYGPKVSIPNETTATPIREILAQLDSMSIPYSPIATREELENLLDLAKSRNEHRSPTPGKESTQVFSAPERGGEVVDEPNVEATATAAKSSFSREEPLQEGIWSRTSRVASKKVKTVPKKVSDTVRKKARTTYRKAQAGVSGLFQDQNVENGPSDAIPIIVDAVVEDFSEIDWNDEVIDVEPLYRESWSTERQGAKSRRRSNSPKSNSPSAKGKVTRDKLRKKRQPSAPDADAPGMEIFSSPQGVTASGTPRLGPAKGSNSHKPGGAQSGARRRAGNGRRIYSPYDRNGGEDSIYADGLDQFGNFVASSVDSLLWGPEDENTPRSASSSSNRQKSASATGRRQQSGHWKDRMEEQFDYLLGIHQDSEYYNRWTKEEVEDERNVEGTDGVSYARGRAPRPGSRRRIREKPVWEEEDSWLSMLFGTDKQVARRNEMFYGPNSFFGSGSLVRILQTLLKSSGLLAGGVCRWASVRGSLPQPVVVVGVLSAALSSRPGSRIRNVFLTVLAIRAAAELLHGYMYDDDDFWDPEEEGQKERVPEKG